MRLYNLTEASIFDERALLNTTWATPQQLTKWLRKNGFKKMGEGAYSAVFVKPGYKRVIKVSMKRDDCWINFAQWAQSVTNNPHLPDIPWVQFFGAGYKQFFVAIIGKLAPFDKSAISATVDLPGLVYMYLHDDWFRGDAGIWARLIDEGLITRYDSSGRRGTRFNAEQLDRKKLLRYLRGVRGGKQFIMTLKAAERKGTGNCRYDMHDGNIMYRPSDKKLVIIDPLADFGGGGYYI
jgi:hypothetical protein